MRLSAKTSLQELVVLARGLPERLYPAEQRSRAQTIERAALLVLVALGWFFRARGVLFGPRLELWNDEASWAMRMFERPLADHLIRPPAFVILTRLSATILGNTEFAFRLLPWLAGMAAPVVAVLLARRTLQSAAARLLFVAVICLSLNAIDFGKEFKPYAIGLLLQLFLPLLVLRWVQTKQRRHLIWCCAAAPLGLFFCQDVMFIYPGVFLVLAIDAWRSKLRRELLLAVAAGAVTAVLVIGCYLLLWRRIPKEEAEAHWGNRYDVFYRGGSKSSGYVSWLAEKYASMAEMPGDRRSFWSRDTALAKVFTDAQELDRLAWLVLHASGVFLIIRGRRWREGLLFWSPTLVCALCNGLGFWPLGAFRTNLFALAGMTGVAVLGIETEQRSAARLRSLLPALLLVGLPLVLFERAWHGKKPGVYAAGTFSLLKTLGKAQAGLAGQKQGLFMDGHSCQPFKYYTRYHPKGKALWRSLQADFHVECDRNHKRLYNAIRKLPRGRVAWVMLAKGTDSPTGWPKDLEVHSRTLRQRHVLLETRSP